MTDHAKTDRLFEIAEIIAQYQPDTSGASIGTEAQAQAQVEALAKAQSELMEFIAALNAEHTATDVIHYIFSAALAHHLSQEDLIGEPETVNLYLQSFDVPQSYLYYDLAKHFPIIPLANEVANRYIAALSKDHEELSIIDIGIGWGHQLIRLLGIMKENDILPQKLTIVGIDPQPDCLETAEKKLRLTSKKLGCDLTFYAFNSAIEFLSVGKWKMLEHLPGDKIINASFSLHHILAHETRELRRETLTRLRNLDPLAVVITEPSSDHATNDFLTRFRNCYTHFQHVFKAIDATVPDEEERMAMKICFFGREIVDILAGEEVYRSERHETTATWVQRLGEAGFGPGPDLDTDIITKVKDTANMNKIQVTGTDEYISLDHEGLPLVSVICAIPNPDTKPPVPATVPERHIYLPEKFNYLEPNVYLAALAVVAKADRIIDPREQAFIDNHAKLLNVSARDHWEVDSLEEVVSSGEEVSEYTKAVILRDLIFLAKIDMEYHASEKAEIRNIARLLGYDEEVVTDAEELTDEFLPKCFKNSPDWFRRYWYIGSKFQL